jgi:hypothetical protein
MEYRYLVDITSSAHERAVYNNLTYIEGIIYNDIAYMEEHYDDFRTDNYKFLHIPKDEYYKALAHLVQMDLITISGDIAKIKNMTIEELVEDPLIAAMMASFIEKTKLDVKFNPLERYCND